MAKKRLPQLARLVAADAADGDLFYVVDVSEVAAADRSKAMTKAEMSTLFAGGGSAGALLKANNLSDLASVPAAISNLGLAALFLGIAATAASATVLATPRAINGVAFDGSAAITVTATAGTLSGTTLAANVLASSLTSVGTLVNLAVTNPITGSVTGNAATATALQTGRTINGTTFDGTANITVAAAAGGLSGTTLASNVVHSSLLDAAGGTFGSAAFVATSAFEASGAVASGIAAHAALQTGVHGISVASGKTLTASNTLTITATDGSTLAIGAGGTLGSAAYLASDTDTSLTANSDSRFATQKAVKAYIDASVVGLLDFKGNTDASANPNYPSASKGDAYYISVAGKVGGASGKSVDIGDVYVANADNAGGTEASVGTSWFVLEHNLVGAAVTSGTLAQFAATTSAQLAGVISDETGSGALVFANTPTFVTPLLGTPTSGNLANCTAYPASALSGSITAAQGPTAAADGATLGFAAFLAADFNASAGVISIDYTNGQAADASHKGFLTSTDWSTFNGKGAGTVTSIATTGPITGGTITGTGTISLLVNTDHLFTAAQSITQAIAATSTTALTLATSATATVGAQKWSGAAVFTGSGWSTTSVAAMPVNWKLELQPVQGAAAPTANLVFSSQINAGGYTQAVAFDSGGSLTIGGTPATFLYFGGATSSFPAFRKSASSASLSLILGDASNFANLTAGTITASNSNIVANTGILADLFINSATRVTAPSAAVLQQGAANAAVPVDQTLQAQGGSGTDKAGANYTIQPGTPTGAGTVSSLIIKAPTLGTTGSTAQTMAEIFRANTTSGLKIASGVALQLGNAAVTGLAAGVLAATTNATVVLVDSAGQAYRVPCII